jgi:hypothetical protein
LGIRTYCAGDSWLRADVIGRWDILQCGGYFRIEKDMGRSTGRTSGDQSRRIFRRGNLMDRDDSCGTGKVIPDLTTLIQGNVGNV